MLAALSEQWAAVPEGSPHDGRAADAPAAQELSQALGAIVVSAIQPLQDSTNLLNRHTASQELP